MPRVVVPALLALTLLLLLNSPRVRLAAVANANALPSPLFLAYAYACVGRAELGLAHNLSPPPVHPCTIASHASFSPTHSLVCSLNRSLLLTL